MNSRLNVNVSGCFPRPMPCSAVMMGTRLPRCSAEEYCSPKPYTRSSGSMAYRSEI